MYKRLVCLCLSALLLTGCGAHSSTGTEPEKTTTSQTTSHTTVLEDSSTSTTTEPSSSHETATTTTTTTQSTILSPTQNAATVTTQTTGGVTTSTTVTTPSSTTTTQATRVIFKATIRDNTNRQPVAGITVTVYADNNTIPLGSAETGNNGVAQMIVTKSTAYRVVLSDLPLGYEADSEYRFSGNTVNITIRKSAVQNEKDHSGAQYAEGRRMTDFSLTDIDGNSYRLSDLLEEKQLVILDFWYTTCEPCKMEFPYFEAAVQKYGSKISLLAVNPINDNKAMQSLRQQLNASSKTAISFPMLRDTCNLAKGFDVEAYPLTVFIDSNGIIVDIHNGAFASEADFLAAVERYLH